LTADFEFRQAVFRRFDLEMYTMLKLADFIGLILHLLSAFHPITPYVVFKLDVQKVFNIFSSSFVVADPRNLTPAPLQEVAVSKPIYPTKANQGF